MTAEGEYVLVPREPDEAMWSGLARQIVLWDRMANPRGEVLYHQLRNCGCPVPDWLLKEIPDTGKVPPKGTVAACIYKAMLAARPCHLDEVRRAEEEALNASRQLISEMSANWFDAKLQGAYERAVKANDALAALGHPHTGAGRMSEEKGWNEQQ